MLIILKSLYHLKYFYANKTTLKSPTVCLHGTEIIKASSLALVRGATGLFLESHAVLLNGSVSAGPGRPASRPK